KKETTASALKPLSLTKVTDYSIRSNISPSHELGKVRFDLFEDLIVEFGEVERFRNCKLIYAKPFRTTQVGLVEAGVFKVSAHQVCVAQVGLHKKRVSEIGFNKKGFVETCFDKKSVFEIGATHVGTLQVGLVKVGIFKVRLVEASTFQVGFDQRRLRNVCGIQIGSGQLDVVEVGSWKVTVNEVDLVNLMSVKPLDVTHGTKGRLFRFPQAEVVDLVAVGADALTFFAALIQPENQDTDYGNVEDHAVRFGENLLDERVEIAHVVFQTQSDYDKRYDHQHQCRGEQWLFEDRVDPFIILFQPPGNGAHG